MASATISKPRPGPAPLQRLRAVRASTWAIAGLALMCAGALAGFLLYPTYPTYDSFYALLWGRDVLHLHVPDFRVYRAPTEHPLAIAFGALSSLFGQGGARVMVLGSVASFVALVAGMYRLGRLCFGPIVGLFAGLLVLTRFYVENLAAQGYLDISYVALIVWAVALEVAKPRRGTAVFLLLAAAGLLRPDAWALSGAYWLWCCWPRRARAAAPPTQPVSRIRYLALALIGPVVWVCVDALVTGDPLYSLHSTSGLAQELERTQGLTGVVASLWTYGVRIDKAPVLLAGIAGVPLAVWLAPRRALTPLAALVALVGVYVVEGAAGASVIDRYLMGAATLLLLFCAVAIGGWAMLERGSRWRQAWMVAAAALVVYGGASAASRFSLTSLRTTLAYHEDFHQGLVAALGDRRVKTVLKRCPLVSLPDNKLIPDARWILGSVGQRNIIARSQARANLQASRPALERRLGRGNVAVFPLGSAVFFEAIVDPGDDPHDQIPQPGYRRIYTSHYYAVYANC